MATAMQRIQRVGARALANDKYSGCSQSVLGALQEEFKIGDIDSFKAATVLSGGIARRGETCGAIVGALMALGLVMGRDQMEDTDQYRTAMEPALEMCQSFQTELKLQFGIEGEIGSTLCRDIQEKLYGRPFDLTNPEELQAFLDAGGHSDEGCPKVCGIAAQVAARKILELRLDLVG